VDVRFYEICFCRIKLFGERVELCEELDTNCPGSAPYLLAQHKLMELEKDEGNEWPKILKRILNIAEISHSELVQKRTPTNTDIAVCIFLENINNVRINQIKETAKLTEIQTPER